MPDFTFNTTTGLLIPNEVSPINGFYFTYCRAYVNAKTRAEKQQGSLCAVLRVKKPAKMGIWATLDTSRAIAYAMRDAFPNDGINEMIPLRMTKGKALADWFKHSDELKNPDTPVFFGEYDAVSGEIKPLVPAKVLPVVWITKDWKLGGVYTRADAFPIDEYGTIGYYEVDGTLRRVNAPLWFRNREGAVKALEYEIDATPGMKAAGIDAERRVPLEHKPE